MVVLYGVRIKLGNVFTLCCHVKHGQCKYWCFVNGWQCWEDGSGRGEHLARRPGTATQALTHARPHNTTCFWNLVLAFFTPLSWFSCFLCKYYVYRCILGVTWPLYYLLCYVQNKTNVWMKKTFGIYWWPKPITVNNLY